MIEGKEKQYVNKTPDELRQGDMIYVQYGMPDNYVHLRIRRVEKVDDTTFDVGVFTADSHPDVLKMDISELIPVLIEEKKEEKKGSNNMAESRISGVHKKLAEVQKRLVAPKNQFNKFGKFYYRSCEDILEGVKPLLAEVGATLTIKDEIFPCEGRIYVKATATFTDIDSMDKIENSALAREEDSKKGMDASQVTGATSSYARKYALNGLFCIDDNKDPDTDEFRINAQQSQQQQQQQVQQSSQQQQADYNTIPNNQFGVQYMVERVQRCCQALNVNLNAVLQYAGISKLEDINQSQYEKVIANFRATRGFTEDLLK